MKIDNIKINSYGNLKDKEINFKNINIIYGKNESGKSTLLNFIKNILFGISKNKNGRDVSDYEKYYPWEGENFSGKIKYKLDNNQTFEIYRDFTKKFPEIYNEQMEEISEKYKTDKKTGAQIFNEQTGVDEQTFMSSAFAMQKEITLDNSTQANLIQKVANLSESGMEDVSYKKALTDLNTMLLTEVGTNNSKDRPINIARENIENYSNELSKMQENKVDTIYIEEKIKKLKEEIEEKTNEQIMLDKIKNLADKNKIEEEKINIKERICEENKRKINDLNNEIEEIENKSKKDKKRIEKKSKKINIAMFIIVILINICSLLFIKNIIINVILLALIPICLIYCLVKNKITKSKDDSQSQINVLKVKIDVLEKSNDETEKEIEELKNKLFEQMQEEKEKIKNETKAEDSLFDENIELLIEENKKDLEECKLQLHKLEIDRENVNPILESIISLEEKLDIEKENLKKLEEKSEEYNMAKELIEDAYIEMKKNVSPKFNQSLSNNIEKISNGKYKNITINDGLMVELNDGRYVNANSLSIGTIEQIYLSLRLSVTDELSKEKLPIMLDEAFAYYDSERLKSALDFLSKCEHQVLIFTCTDREKKLLDTMNVQYNFMEL